MCKSPKHEPTDSYFYTSKHLAVCMMRSDTFNSHVEPVRTQMTYMQKMNISEMNTQNIPNLYVCSFYKSESKGIIADENLLQVCYTYNIESEIVIVIESSTEESEPKSVRKSFNTNKVKDAIDKTEDEEISVTDNPVINYPRYFNLFECGKNFLNNIDYTCERACMATSKDKYYTEMCNTLSDYNDRNNMPLSNAKIR